MKPLTAATTGSAPYVAVPYAGLQGIALQSYAPIGSPRDLSPAEAAEVERGKAQWISKISPGYATPLPQMLSSPGKGAAMAVGAGTAIGLVAGAAKVIAGAGASTATAASAFGALGVAGAIGAAVGALVGAAVYFGRRQKNEDVLDMIRRLPEAATKRDMLSDPVVQRDLDRSLAVQTSASRGAGDLGLLSLGLGTTALALSGSGSGSGSSR